MEHERLKFECVILATTFEIYWAYYLQSSTRLFEQECRKSAKLFLEAFDELAQVQASIKDPTALRLAYRRR
jgi:hypothetical protein